MWASVKSLFGKRDRSEVSDKKQEKLEKKYGLISGGAKRDDGQVNAGWANTRGRRYYNEDNVYCKFHPIPGGHREGSTAEVACMAVFDGHGGAAASIYVRDNLFNNLLKHALFKGNLFKALEDAFVETDQAYIAEDEQKRNDDGSTATTAVLVGRRLVVAHVGDSRAVLGHGKKAIELTEDHKPNRPDEKKRIQDIGGTVVHAGTWRVGGVLAVSRSFGNRMMKQYIVALPEIREDSLHSENSCLILATDGVWDVVTNEEAVELVHTYSDAEAAARALTAMAYERGSYDNISSVVCTFTFDPDDDLPFLAEGDEGEEEEAADEVKAEDAGGANSARGGFARFDTAKTLYVPPPTSG